MHPYTYSITLRVKHPKRSLSFLEGVFNLKAQREWDIGEQRTTPKGNILEGKHTESYWCASLENRKKSKQESVEKSLEKWTEILSAYKSEINNICTEGGTVEYFVWLYCNENMGFEINSKLMANISGLKVNLAVVCDPEKMTSY